MLSADRLAPLVAALPDRPSETATIPRPTDVAAPTNRWYSGMVFGDGMEPVFPMPMSFQLVPAVSRSACPMSLPAGQESSRPRSPT